jgi:hypothetical protein
MANDKPQNHFLRQFWLKRPLLGSNNKQVSAEYDTAVSVHGKLHIHLYSFKDLLSVNEC